MTDSDENTKVPSAEDNTEGEQSTADNKTGSVPAKKRAAPKKRTAAKKATKAGNGSRKSEASQGELLYSTDADNGKENSTGSGSETDMKPSEDGKKPGRDAEQSEGRDEDSARRDSGDHSGKPQQNQNSQQNQNRNSGQHRNHHSGNQSGGKSNSNKSKGNKNNKQQQNQKHNKQKHKQLRRKQRKQEEEADINLGNLPVDSEVRNLDTLGSLAESIVEAGKTPFSFNESYELPLNDLRDRADAEEIRFETAPNRRRLVNALIQKAFESKRPIMVTGVLDIMDDDLGGLLVFEVDNYRVRPLSVFIPEPFIRKYGMLPGQIVEAQVHPHRENESCPFVVKVEKVMGMEPEEITNIVPFTERVPYYPTKRILLESAPDAEFEVFWDNISMRTVDCISPVGFGQRGLIVSPPRVGKTVLLQCIANSVQNNYPDAHLIILLIDERPEEVTDFRRQVKGGEVIASTFDEAAESHVHAAEMVIEKARRLTEIGEDVVILLDSVTRLARAYNTTQPSSGKILSGGVEANALQKPKRFFGSARNIEDGGSLTIIATALIDTGSKMDEVIFEEFKGTGNMELHLDRELADKRVFPAMSFARSGTRKEELLYHPDEMQKIYSLRRAMKGVPSGEAMEMLVQRLKKTKSNAEFLMTLSR